MLAIRALTASAVSTLIFVLWPGAFAAAFCNPLLVPLSNSLCADKLLVCALHHVSIRLLAFDYQREH